MTKYNLEPFETVAIPPGIVVFNCWALPGPDDTELYGALVITTDELLELLKRLNKSFRDGYKGSPPEWDRLAAMSLEIIAGSVATKGRAYCNAGDGNVKPSDMIFTFAALIWAMREAGYSPEEMQHLAMGGGISFSVVCLTPDEVEVLSKAGNMPSIVRGRAIAFDIDLNVCRVRTCDAPILAERLRGMTPPRTVH